jgi:hypothetical protein
MDPIQTNRGAATMAAGVDPGEMIATLAVENGEAERTTAHQDRDAEEAAEAQANAAEVQAMHDEASSLRSQGLFDAATSVAGAVIGVACAQPAAGQATGVGQAAGNKPSPWGIVGGHLSDGIEKLGDGFWKAGQHNDEARAAADRASATQHADAAKDAGDAATDASGAIGSALDFARNYSSTVAQTQLAALHRA